MSAKSTAVHSHPLQPPEFIKLLANPVRWGLLKALTISDYQVNELVALLQQPMNLVSYHLRRMREDALVTTRRSEADRRDVYYSLDVSRLRQRYLEAGQELHPTLGNARLSASSTPQLQLHRVLFVCTHNSARSQMAEGLLRHLSNGKLEVFSAGSHPTHVHPDAVRAMNQFGIDITHQRSRPISDVVDMPFDYVITVCDKAREVCPTFPSSGAQLHWGYPDPVAVENEQERSAMFKQTAQQLQSRIEHFLSSLAALSEHNEDLT